MKYMCVTGEKTMFNMKKHTIAQLDFTGNPLPHRTFDQMGRDFSPEGTFNHCGVCKKRVPTNDLISEDNGVGGLVSVCSNCRESTSGHSVGADQRVGTSKSAQAPYEKYHRDENLGPKANDSAPIWDKQLPHRDGFEQKITEDQMKSEHEWGDNEKAKPIEKLLESATSKYVKHRSDAGDLTVPPMNALVEKMRQKRLAEDYQVDKKPHWSHTFNEKTQQGSLPKWNKNAPQHDRPVLNNDPNRFAGTNDDPTEFHTEKIQPLTGGITTADVNRVATHIKTGQAAEYDGAIMAILRLAHNEKRELSHIEQKTIVDLKIARTDQMIQK